MRYLLFYRQMAAESFSVFLKAYDHHYHQHNHHTTKLSVKPFIVLVESVWCFIILLLNLIYV